MTPIQEGGTRSSVSRFPLDSGWAEVIITTGNPGTLQRTTILMNRYDVITRLTLANFSGVIIKTYRSSPREGLAKNYALASCERA